MAQYLNAKSVRVKAHASDKRIGRGFIEELDRIVNRAIETAITNVGPSIKTLRPEDIHAGIKPTGGSNV